MAAKDQISLIEKLPEILKGAREEYEACKAKAYAFDGAFGQESSNILAIGDNMAFMRYLQDNMDLEGKIQLIYIDPPFFSKSNYGAEIRLSSEKLGKMPAIKQFAYEDSWTEGKDDYLRMLCTRFYMMRDMLKDEGCLWVHLDWHVVHYVKILLDAIFGEENFINEVVWNYKSGGSSKKHYSRKHDTLLFYAKTKKYYFEPQKEKSYNRGFKPYRFKGVAEYRDEKGWYTMVNMRDVWQLDMVGRTSAERTGYVTQKPETLISRILESCSKPGDIVADFFGGSGTLQAAADKMDRHWIYCDLGHLAAESAVKRLAKNGSEFSMLVQEDLRAKNMHVSAAASYIDQITSDKLLEIRLEGYSINDDYVLPVDSKNEPAVREALSKDPTAFIDMWSIDFDYDGTHKSDMICTREKGNLPLSVQKFGTSDVVSIKVWDVFGNTEEILLRPGN